MMAVTPQGQKSDSDLSSHASSAGASFFARLAIGLAFVFVLGTLLRVWYFGAAIDSDEAYTYLNYAVKPWLTIMGKYNLPNNHILNSLLIHGARKAWGDSLWTLRAPAFIAGLLTIPLSAWMGFELARESGWSQRRSLIVAAVTACFTAISYRLIHYSVDARGYILQTAFTLLSVIAARRIVSARSAVWPVLFAVSTALGLYAVPTHLYAAASVSLWLIAVGASAWKRVSWAFVLSVAFSALLYLPVVFYLAMNGTKIESAETWQTLFPAVAFRVSELGRYWVHDHSLVAMACFALGLLICLAPFKGINSRIRLLILALILGPALMFVLSKRPAPFQRVWTYLLPLLFALAAMGWLELLGRIRAQKIKWLAMLVAFIVPAAGTLYATFQNGTSELRGREALAADKIFRFCADRLKLGPGDHLGIPNLLYEGLKFSALTQAKDQSFKFAPILRQTENDLTVIEQNGETVKKENPFDPRLPGRVYLVMTSPKDLEKMRSWLGRYLKPGHVISERPVPQAQIAALPIVELVTEPIER
jgi:hypothetical protein